MRSEDAKKYEIEKPQPQTLNQFAVQCVHFALSHFCPLVFQHSVVPLILLLTSVNMQATIGKCITDTNTKKLYQ